MLTRTIWLSFLDPDRPEGDRILGVTVVDVTEDQATAAALTLAAFFPKAGRGAAWIAAAIQQAHQTGSNPGGEVATVDLTDVTAPEKLAQIPRNRLLTRPELERLELI